MIAHLRIHRPEIMGTSLLIGLDQGKAGAPLPSQGPVAACVMNSDWSGRLEDGKIGQRQGAPLCD